MDPSRSPKNTLEWSSFQQINAAERLLMLQLRKPNNTSPDLMSNYLLFAEQFLSFGSSEWWGDGGAVCEYLNSPDPSLVIHLHVQYVEYAINCLFCVWYTNFERPLLFLCKVRKKTLNINIKHTHTHTQGQWSLVLTLNCDTELDTACCFCRHLCCHHHCHWCRRSDVR